MSSPNWWGDWRPTLTPHTGNLLATDLIECTMIVGGLPVNTVITGAQILGAVPSGGGLTVGTTAIASGTVGRILFEGTGNVLQQSANLFWDNTNSRLGIGQSTPTARIHIQGSSALSANSSLVVFNSTPTEIFRIRDNGNVQIGALTDAGYKLDVNGTGAFRNTLSFLPPLASTAQTAINIYRGASTSAIALSIGITSADDAIFNTANADYIFNRSNVERFRIGVSSITSNYLINPKVTIPSGTTINYGLNVSNAAGAERIRLGIDVSENAVISLGNTSLRIRQTTSNFDFLFIDSTSGNVVIEKNTSTLVSIASAKLALNSTTSGFLPPRMTTAQKNAIASPAAGLVVYDTTLNKLCVRTASSWETITSL